MNGTNREFDKPAVCTGGGGGGGGVCVTGDSARTKQNREIHDEDNYLNGYVRM